MAHVWKRTDGDLTAVYGAMLDHPAAWRDEGAKARQPFDYIVAGLRALNAGSGNGIAGDLMKGNQEDDDEVVAPPKDMAGQDNGRRCGRNGPILPTTASPSGARLSRRRGCWGRVRFVVWGNQWGTHSR
nr:DUF1800 family protein [Rhizobium mongolense]